MNTQTTRIGGNLAGHQLGIGAGHIDVSVGIFQQAVDSLIPSGDSLYSSNSG